MPTLSYVHQLFSLEQCQAYIHTLRWKDRALQCPRCQSQDVDPWGLLSYLATHLMQSYHMLAGDTALPLALVGGGVVMGGFLGGRVADHRCRLLFFALSCVGSGLPAAVVFTAEVPPWTIVAFACGAASLARISSVVVPTFPRKRESRGRGAWELDARLRGHDVLLASDL